MIKYRKILEMYFRGVSQRAISTNVGSSRNTISTIIKRAYDLGLTELKGEHTDQQLEEVLFPEKQALNKGYYPVDWEEVHKKLQKKNVTLKLLHSNYEKRANSNGKIPYSYRSFAEKYAKYSNQFKVAKPVRRKPGEILEIGWLGNPLSINDPTTGEPVSVFIFVAVFPYSYYSCAKAFLDKDISSWLRGHKYAFERFKGVPESLMPFQLRTITKPPRVKSRYSEIYRELADHYQTMILLGRDQRGQERSHSGEAIEFVSKQIFNALRTIQCSDIEEMNTHLQEILSSINQEPFQKHPGSRAVVFNEEEKPYLQPLNQVRFRVSEWRVAKVQSNHHILVDHMYYSVPYEYMRSTVDVLITRNYIEVYLKGVRIASHKKLKGPFGQYVTFSYHMPEKDRLLLEHPVESPQVWAKTIGDNMVELVDILLKNNPRKKALYQIMTLRNLMSKYSKQEMDDAAKKLLLVSSRPTSHVFKAYLDKSKSNKKQNQNE